jgi:hypothetical protein
MEGRNRLQTELLFDIHILSKILLVSFSVYLHSLLWSLIKQSMNMYPLYLSNILMQ